MLNSITIPIFVSMPKYSFTQTSPFLSASSFLSTSLFLSKLKTAERHFDDSFLRTITTTEMLQNELINRFNDDDWDWTDIVDL